MACFVWLLPSTHTHTHWLADCPHALHTPPPLGVRVLIHLLSSATHTHTRDAQAWPMHGWLLVWSPPPRPLCPTITHTHTAGLVVWAMVVLGGARVPCVCLPRHHHTRLPFPPPPTLLCHHRPHTHTGLGACTTATHTRHMHHHTHQGVLCVDHTMPHPPPPTPSPHSHTHHMAHTHGISHTATMVLAIAHHAVHSHTQLMPHTHHTGDRPRPSTPLAVAFREPPPPRWSCPFALLSSSLLVHQPLFSLSQACTHTPLMCSSPPPCHPSRVWCVCCGDGQHQAPQWW